MDGKESEKCAKHDHIYQVQSEQLLWPMLLWGELVTSELSVSIRTFYQIVDCSSESETICWTIHQRSVPIPQPTIDSLHSTQQYPALSTVSMLNFTSKYILHIWRQVLSVILLHLKTSVACKWWKKLFRTEAMKMWKWIEYFCSKIIHISNSTDYQQLQKSSQPIV